MKSILTTLLACSIYLTAGAQCNAAFTAIMTPQGNNLLQASLTNTSSAPLTGNQYRVYTVNWGDGTIQNISHGTTTTHDYTSTGKSKITIVATVLDSISTGWTVACSDTTADTLDVQYTACATAITLSKTGFTATATANTPAAGGSTTYSWNWGDGTTNSSSNPASHVYATAGLKTVTVTATNGSCVYTNVQTIYVGTGVNCNAIPLQFSANGNNTKQFYSSRYPGYGEYMRYTWHFGDGNSQTDSTTSSVTHTYAAAGTYNVLHIATLLDSLTGAELCRDSVAKQVSVNNIVSGSIRLDSNGNVTLIDSPEYKVWLIVYDSATGNLTAIDSQVVQGVNFSVQPQTPYIFYGHSAGAYRIKAQLLNGPTSGSGWVPTYHVSSLMWNTATLINHDGFASLNKHIVLQSGTPVSGPGFVGGNVSAGANKGTANNGIEGLNIFLLDASGTLVAHAVTDVNGNYSFSQLPPATYSVYPENMGFNTTPVSVSVVAGKPNVTGIDFERSLANKTITPKSLAVTDVNTSFITTIYPNPANDKIAVNIANLKGEYATIIISDVTGKTVRTVNTNKSATEITLSDLQKGLYLITVSADNVQQTMKLLLQ